MAFFSKISYQEKVFFTKHLALMIAAGIPIGEALDTLSSQTKSVKFRKILKEILSEVENGSSLAKAFKKQGNVFSELYISLVKVGEKSGTLEETLKFLAKQMTKENSLRKKIQAAMLYPALVLGASVIIGGFISFYILPKLIDLFESFDIKLPLTTRILLWVAYALRDYGVHIAIGIILLFLVGVFLYRYEKVKLIIHKALLKLPILGDFFTYVQLATFTRNLATLLKNSVSITSAMETTSRTLTNIAFRKDVESMAKGLNEGKSIEQILENKRYKKFPVVVQKMIGVGEKTGKLDETLFYLSDFFEDDIDNISKNLTTVLEPVLLIVIGLLVGFIALSIITPIYELTGSIRR